MIADGREDFEQVFPLNREHNADLRRLSPIPLRSLYDLMETSHMEKAI